MSDEPVVNVFHLLLVSQLHAVSTVLKCLKMSKRQRLGGVKRTGRDVTLVKQIWVCGKLGVATAMGTHAQIDSLNTSGDGVRLSAETAYVSELLTTLQRVSHDRLLINW